jgi:plastocyanin
MKMRMRTMVVPTLLGVAAAVALPAAAQARTKTVDMGTPVKYQKQLQQTLQADANAFFPNGITVHAGDKVRFVPVGFHSVDLPKRKSGPVPLISSTGQKEPVVNDAAGTPFWFSNVTDVLGFTPSLLASNFGKSVAYNGRKQVLSGLPLAPKVKPMTVRFTKAGTYVYHCNIHPGMTGKVTVKKARAAIPSAKADRKAVKRQAAKAIATAKTLAAVKAPANTVDVGVAGKGGVERFAMVPATLSVGVGQPVKFRMTPGTREVHTATFGPGSPDQPTSYLGQIEAGFNAVPFDGRSVYPSDPGPASITPALHGNGFWNTGAMDHSSATVLPSSMSVTFGAPGTYQFFCLVHPFMHGTISVK